MKHSIVQIAFAGVVAATLPSAAALAQTTVSKPTVKSASGQLGASINTAGLQQSFDFTESRKLTASKNPWLADAHIAGGSMLAATPAGVRGGAWVEFAPASVFLVRAGVEEAQYFGTFHSLTSFDSRLDAFDPNARKERGGAASGRTTKLYVAPTLQLRAGRFAARTQVSFERWSSSAPGPLFYEPTRDTLLAVDGDDLATLAQALLYQAPLTGGGSVSIGPMYSQTRMHGDESRMRGEFLNQIRKVGAVFIGQTAGRHLGLIRPNLSAQVAYYLDDPSKKGQWSAAMAIGFSLRK